MQAFQGGGFPKGKELGLEIMLTAKLRLVGGAAQELKDELGLELGSKGSTLTTRHRNSPGGVQYLLCYWSSARGAPQYDEVGLTTPLDPDQSFTVNFSTVENEAGKARLNSYTDNIFTDGTLIFFENNVLQHDANGNVRVSAIGGELGPATNPPSHAGEARSMKR